jgi:toxin HigB-1
LKPPVDIHYEYRTDARDLANAIAVPDSREMEVQSRFEPMQLAAKARSPTLRLRFEVAKGYTRLVIQSFAHKGLARFYHTGSKSGIQAKHAERLRLILTNLDQAEGPEDMDLPGLASHELKGKRKGVWAVKVSSNWRVTFRFAGGDVEQVNYEDYH